MTQRNGSWPGKTVVPRVPWANGPSIENCAGGSFHVVTSVRIFHANSGVTAASTECSSTTPSLRMELFLTSRGRTLHQHQVEAKAEDEGYEPGVGVKRVEHRRIGNPSPR